MRTLIRHLLAATLLVRSVVAVACPICQGAYQQSSAQKLTAAPAAMLAVPTEDASRFRVVQVIKGERPADGTIEGGYPRSATIPAGATPTNAHPLLLVRDDPLPTWIILGAIDAAQADWLRTLAAGKPVTEMSPEEWRARVELVIPHVDDPEPLAADLACAELAAAPYSALRTAKPYLDAAALRRGIADPSLAARQPLRLLLLGIAGNPRDAADLDQRLETAWQSGDAANLGVMLTADLELRGAERIAWVESHYLADRKRSPAEVKAALLALSVHGGANGAIPRERVIQSYRLFMQEHREVAGYVAPDLAAWQYWAAVPDYLALLKSAVRVQYPSRLAILGYLRQSPDADARGFAQRSAAQLDSTISPSP